ncbi:uncharacterized protein LOC114251638 [Bombyx mandarina]|nr:uncharacterized protein LOC114251638 [Bombyx mandarina]
MQKRQVDNFRMSDAPEPKKVKGKGKDREEDTQVWGSCPLLPGVPTVPPQHVPQPWELQRSHDNCVGELQRSHLCLYYSIYFQKDCFLCIIYPRFYTPDIKKEEEEDDDVMEGTTPDFMIPLRLLAQAVQSAGTPARTAQEPVMGTINSSYYRVTTFASLSIYFQKHCFLCIIYPRFYNPEITKEEEEDDYVIEGTTPDFMIPQPPLTQAVQSADMPARTAQEPVMEITKEEEEDDDVMEGTTPDFMIPLRLLAQTVQSADTPAQTAQEPIMGKINSSYYRVTTFASLSIYFQKHCFLCIIYPCFYNPEITKEEEEDDYVIEGTTPDFMIPQPPLAQAVQSAGTPARTAEEPVMAPTTSTTASGFGRSAYEFDVEVHIKRDFKEPGEGSEVELEEDPVDITLKPRKVDEYPVDSESLAAPSLVEAINSIDAEADLALRTVLDPGPDQDLLSFDWRCDAENFEGVREVFTVPSTGPTFKCAELTPLGVFLKIWDADIIAHIVRETNRYGGEMLRRNEKPNSRLKRWQDVTDDDIKKFFAIIMLQSLVTNNVEREYWYPKLDELRIGNFGDIMPYNRFLIIKRCLHFVNNASLPVPSNRLDKIMPVIEHLNEKFSSLYILEQNVAIDESLLLWKGRLTFSQKIATKKARVGIKSYELYESRTGYLWRMEVYSGKGHIHVAQVGVQEPVEEHEEGDEPESATSKIVLTLMRPLFNRGHTLVMDNFYNAPLLSRILKVKHKTDSMGALRLIREFVPEGLREKAKKNMKAGEVAFSTTKDLSVEVWMDKNVVAMISTFHQVKIGGIEKYGYYRYKPQVVLDYNLSMDGLNHKDQMLQAYPMEKVRKIIWYKKLFRRLVNVSIHNSFVLFNHNRTQVIGNREFRLQLVKELLQVCGPRAIPRPIEPVAPAAPSQMHLPVKNERSQRCKMCHAAKVRRTTVWRCSTCAVNLCIEGCYIEYHK